MISASVLARRLADADADAGEGVAVEMGLDGPKPVVAGQAATRLDLEPADRQIQLVVNDHQLGQVVDTEAADQRQDGQSGLVDVGLRKGEGQSFSVHPALGDQ
jgi:hypothetical protein